MVGGFATRSTIALGNGHSYEKFELTNFISLNPRGFKAVLSAYIEHFKNRTTV